MPLMDQRINAPFGYQPRDLAEDVRRAYPGRYPRLPPGGLPDPGAAERLRQAVCGLRRSGDRARWKRPCPPATWWSWACSGGPGRGAAQRSTGAALDDIRAATEVDPGTQHGQRRRLRDRPDPVASTVNDIADAEKASARATASTGWSAIWGAQPERLRPRRRREAQPDTTGICGSTPRCGWPSTGSTRTPPCARRPAGQPFVDSAGNLEPDMTRGRSPGLPGVGASLPIDDGPTFDDAGHLRRRRQHHRCARGSVPQGPAVTRRLALVERLPEWLAGCGLFGSSSTRSSRTWSTPWRPERTRRIGCGGELRSRRSRRPVVGRRRRSSRCRRLADLLVALADDAQTELSGNVVAGRDCRGRDPREALRPVLMDCGHCAAGARSTNG